MTVLTTYLGYEAFEVESLNLLTDAIPDDCDILAIMSPTVDFFETEVAEIKNYINKGGKIYFTYDTIFENKDFPNMQSLFDEFGFSIKNGYIIETEQGKSADANYPYLFIPEVSQDNEITDDIYSANTKIILRFASKLEYKDENTLSALGVTKETLLSSSSSSQFITNVMANSLNEAMQTVENGSADISALFKKNVKSTNENGEEQTNTSELIIVTCGSFIADTRVSELGSSYPLSAYGSNKDFVINGLSYLGKKENNLTIRKDIAGASYIFTATEKQDIIVRAIIFIIPLVIIFVGIIVMIYRKKRK